eukprot:GHVU01207625.1.p2 GENE.GHVU01207625.1~~GHVU01207625.1.p2  ORF type:complete len:164 (-),score=31.46 GHVU01207625.1:102-593(-)
MGSLRLLLLLLLGEADCRGRRKSSSVDPEASLREMYSAVRDDVSEFIHCTVVAGSKSVNETLKRLETAIATLENETGQEVSSCIDELIAKAGALQRVKAGVAELKGSAGVLTKVSTALPPRLPLKIEMMKKNEDSIDADPSITRSLTHLPTHSRSRYEYYNVL